MLVVQIIAMLMACENSFASSMGCRDWSPLRPTNEAQDHIDMCLAILENKQLDDEQRTKAALRLGEYRNVRAVPRLLKLLPAPANDVTHCVIRALADIGDKKALPVLHEMYEKMRYPGSTRVLLKFAIEKCENGGH